ncbi:hypothetical protein PGN80_13150 [Klebsiella aerogenes]|uniref:hypothetical protein n=1 Tax=Klebsiella aerogenes TaxID=548 RepID=UPI00301D829B
MKTLIMIIGLMATVPAFANTALDENAFAQEQAAYAAQDSADAQAEAADAASTRTINSMGTDAFYGNMQAEEAQEAAADAAQEQADAQQQAAFAAEDAADAANY